MSSLSHMRFEVRAVKVPPCNASDEKEHALQLIEF